MRHLKVGDTKLVCGFHTVSDAGEWRYINGIEELLFSLRAGGDDAEKGFIDFSLLMTDLIITIKEVVITECNIEDVLTLNSNLTRKKLTANKGVSYYCRADFIDDELDFCYLRHSYPTDYIPSTWRAKSDDKHILGLIPKLKLLGVPYSYYDLERLCSYLANETINEEKTEYKEEMTKLMTRISAEIRGKHHDWVLKYLSDSVTITKID